MSISFRFLAPSAKICIALAICAPARLSWAQSPEIFILKQLTLILAEGTAASEVRTKVVAFQLATKAITSCKKADEVALEIGASVRTSQVASLTEIPKPLQEEIEAKGPGHATSIFRHGNIYRTLILCQTDG